jgi:hypothetical protein
MLTLPEIKVLMEICGLWNDKIIGRIWEVLTEQFLDLHKSISSVKIVE